MLRYPGIKEDVFDRRGELFFIVLIVSKIAER